MRIAVIGAGGIGSYLVRALHELIDINQLSDTDITVFDDDSVEEDNILYQDYSLEDVLNNKAEALADRYMITAKASRVTSESALKGFDLIVSCVDNTATRKLIYGYCYAKKKDFIDLRSEGKSYAVFTKTGASLNDMLSTLPEKEVVNGSCQLDSDKQAGTMQQGNKIVALIGSQLILDRARGIDSRVQLRQTL